jgi:glycosyl transferase family 25
VAAQPTSAEAALDSVVISLLRTPERLGRFRAVNPHVDAEHLIATDGAMVERPAYIPAKLPFTPGAIGCYMSHVEAWRRCAAGDRNVTVFEDDAIVHRDFDRLADTAVATLPAHWHFCLWGANPNAALLFDLMPGVSRAILVLDQDAVRSATPERFQSQVLRPTHYPVWRFHGTPGYMISPAGARALLDLCIPAPDVVIGYPGMRLPNNNVDRSINAAINSGLAAFVCVPPVVTTRNEEDVSTVQPRGTGPSGNAS